MTHKTQIPMDNWTSLSTGLVQFIFRFILLYFVTTSIKRPKKQVFKGFFGAVVIKKAVKLNNTMS